MHLLLRPQRAGHGWRRARGRGELLLARAWRRLRRGAGQAGGEGEGEGGRACSVGVSCQPVMVPEPWSVSKVEIAPSSIAQYLVRYCGGRFNALATSDALTITVFLPFPRPSSLPVIGGIL